MANALGIGGGTTTPPTQKGSTSGFRTYENDEAKAATYDHRLYIADEAFDEWKSSAEDWYHRYENLPRRQQMTTKGHRVNVATGVSVIDALYSSMTAVDVDVMVSQRGRATRAQAELATAALAGEWRILDVQTKSNDAVKDALIVGIGWVKVAYEYESVMKTLPRPQAAIRADIEALITGVIRGGGTPDPEVVAGQVALTEEAEHVLRDRVVVDYVPWADVRWDPAAKRKEDLTWVAQYTSMRVDEVKNNPTWREYVKRSRQAGGLKVLDDLKGGSTFETTKLPGGKVTADDEFLTVVELWDLQSGTVCTFIKGQKWLLNETANPFALNIEFKDRSPFVPLVLRKTNTRVRGISDMELVAPSLDEQNVYRTNTAQYIERFKPKVMGPEDALTDEGKEALANDEFGAYVSIAREYAQDAAAVKAMDPPVLPSEAWDMERRIEDSVREATGVNELMRGLFPDRKRTATETSEVVASSTVRQSEKRNTLEQFYTDIATRILQLMQMFYEAPRVARYVDATFGEVKWEFTADDVQMEYDLSISLTPMEAVTKQSEREDAIGYFNMMLELAYRPDPSGAPLVDGAQLIAWFSRKYGLLPAEVLEILNLPEEKQAAQLASQQAAAGMASAQAGAPQPGMTSGPLSPEQVAAFTNQGAVPPEIAAQAVGGIGPGVEQAVETVSESAGVQLP